MAAHPQINRNPEAESILYMPLEPSETTCERGRASITPLRKRTLGGKLYARFEKVEAKLLELQPLSREELVVRCAVEQRDDPVHVPTECLLYFVRACRMDSSDDHFERLYKILAARVLRRLPTAESADGGAESLSKGTIREKAFGRFVEMLVTDRNSYSEKLDFFEIRFDMALAKLRHDAQKEVWREENRSRPLELDEETGELSAEVERAAGSFNLFDAGEFNGADYRLRLNAAIESLPTTQRTIIEMIRKDIPIDSKDPDAVTIAKTLGKSEKTIRTHRDKAYAALRAAVKRGQEQ